MASPSTPPPVDSNPESEGAQRPAAAPERRSRFLDTLTTLALTAAFVLLLFAAMPSLMRVAGLGQRSQPVTIDLRGTADAPEHAAPLPGFGPLDDDDLPGDDPFGQTDGVLPRHPSGPRVDPQADGPGEDRPSPRMRPATVRRSIKLHVDASEDSDSTGALKKGDSVFIIKENGDWVLILRSGEDGVVMGWTKSAELAIR